MDALRIRAVLLRACAPPILRSYLLFGGLGGRRAPQPPAERLTGDPHAGVRTGKPENYRIESGMAGSRAPSGRDAPAAVDRTALSSTPQECDFVSSSGIFAKLTISKFPS